jgi:CRISPR-associated endonuclease/helicase Cas3
MQFLLLTGWINFMGADMKTGSIWLANTKAQPLVDHCFAVGFLAKQMLKKLLDDRQLIHATFVAGVLHDVGKLDPAFQEWLRSKFKATSVDEVPEQGQHIDKGTFTFENHARHNEISLLLYFLLDDSDFKKVNRQNKALIRHVLYWHHAKPIRKEPFESLDSIYKNLNTASLDYLTAKVNQFKLAINYLANKFDVEECFCLEGLLDEINSDALYDLPSIFVPDYKQYHTSSNSLPDFVRSIDENAKLNLARAAVVSADRLISALSAEQLMQHLASQTLDQIPNYATQNTNTLLPQLLQCMTGFKERYPESERNLSQSTAAENLRRIEGVAVLEGPAGCGKTKIALEWAQKGGARKIIWICPRVQICQGLMLDLTSSEYLPNARIEIYTGEFQYIAHQGGTCQTGDKEAFSGDIVLTTVDQILNLITTHRNVTGLLEFLQAHVVFDEFHEYISMPGFNLLFAELVRCKQFCRPRANTLLVSATPNYRFVQNLLGLDLEDIVRVASFNRGLYRIELVPFEEGKKDSDNPFFAPQPSNTIVISNTATTAQLSYIANLRTEKALLIHSKFKASDKKDLFSKVFASFGPNGDHSYDILRSGPIVQAALNITSGFMVTEFTHAENWLQRLGRLNRFSEQRDTVWYKTAIPMTLIIGGRGGACERFLAATHTLESAKAWYSHLQGLDLTAGYTVNQIYQWYDDFYASSEGKQAVDRDLLRSLRKGVEVVKSRLLDPVCLPILPKKTDNKRLKRVSLRGDSRYVQLAMLRVESLEKWEILDRYACDKANAGDLLTLPVNEIEGYDAMGDNNLMRYMHQKHHKIMKAKGLRHKKSYKLFLLEQQAIDSEHPIFVSYTTADLGLCHDTPHPRAIYYIIGDRQPIGALSFHKLTHNKE